jgi:oligoendopeptidase F
MWARRSHYFYPFYLFEYATGVSAAIYIASKIINNEDNMKIKYMEFLKAGETNYPTELLKAIGVDMTKPKVILNAIDFFNNLLDEFNKESDS